jgi:hypothetical protein
MVQPGRGFMSDDKPKRVTAFDHQTVAHQRAALQAKRAAQVAPAPTPKPTTPPKKG